MVDRRSRSTAGLTRLQNLMLVLAAVTCLSLGCDLRTLAQIPAESSSANGQSIASVSGTALDAERKPVAAVLISLSDDASSRNRETQTDRSGRYQFSALPPGRYTLSAEIEGRRSAPIIIVIVAGETAKQVDVALPSSMNSVQAMEFADKPNFTVAGVTDWTAVGGHGSDASLRTSEDLARETLTLKAGRDAALATAQGPAQKETESRLLGEREKNPTDVEINHALGHLYLTTGRYRDAIDPLRTAYLAQPTNGANALDLVLAYKGAGEFTAAQYEVKKLLARNDTAELHRIAGQLDEKLGDPLSAVQQDELAVRMDPSEPNYFEWGSELLLHRAVRQAVDVFRNGSKAHPESARMLAGLGASLFASAAYDEAAQRLCEASDLEPAAEQAYLFLGEVEIAAPAPLSCVEPKLERFVQLHPDNPQANYLYAMAIWKRQEATGQTKDAHATQQAETMLSKAVALDGKCFEAYLQMGVIRFEQRDYPAAVGFYTKAIEVNPQLGEAHYRLGVAYDRLGEHGKAREEFQRHTDIEREQAAAVERQRRDVKQFEIVLDARPAASATP